MDSLLESRETILRYFAEININDEKLEACGTGLIKIGPIIYKASFYTAKTAPISQDAVTAFLQSAASADNELASLIRAVCAKEADAQQLAVFTNHVSQTKMALESKLPSQQTVFRIANNGTSRCFPNESIIENRSYGKTMDVLISTVFLSLGSSASYQPVTIHIYTEDKSLWGALSKSVLDEELCRSAIQKKCETLKRAAESTLEFLPEQQVLRPIAPHIAPSLSHETRLIGNDKKPPKSLKQGKPRKLPNIQRSGANETQLKVKLEKTPKIPRSRKGRIADPSKKCHSCGTSQTALWRKALIGGQIVTVCNSCGIKYATKIKKANTNDDPQHSGDEALRMKSTSPMILGKDESRSIEENTVEKEIAAEKEPIQNVKVPLKKKRKTASASVSEQTGEDEKDREKIGKTVELKVLPPPPQEG